MADYKQQQMVDAANALAQKRKADAQKQMADAAAKEELDRYDRASQNNAGAGRGKQGGPTAEELSDQKYAKGGAKRPGLYANIHRKQERIKHEKAVGKPVEHMRKPNSKGAPTADAFKQSAKTAKMKTGGKVTKPCW